MHVNNKIIFITGATRGIGKAIALKLAAAGGHVAFTYFQSGREEVQAMEVTLRQFNIKTQGFYLDASNFDSTTKVVEEVVKVFGRLDILINNAGITKDNLLLRMTEADWDTILNVNLKSHFNTVKAAMKTLLKQRRGSIINISSVVGIHGNIGQANYAAAKAGIIGLTKSLALELGSRNIRVNAIAPGFISTAMTDCLTDKQLEAYKEKIPLNRLGLPEDVANCVLFLASDASSYITGQVIPVDGGMFT